MRAITYRFTHSDFNKAFQFAVTYHLDPTKQQIGRTSAEPRGLGGVLDAFTRGKLVEIGVSQLIHVINPDISCELDFEMHSVNEVRTDPDIILITENGESRRPKIFTEIKNTLPNDRYIGVTEEQLTSIKSGAGDKQIINIYASISVDKDTDNPRTTDFVGMYLKHLTGHEIFNEFQDVTAIAKLEFIVTVEDLERFGTRFPAGELFLETDMFSKTIKIFKKDGELVKGIELIKEHINYDSNYNIPLKSGKLYSPYGEFHIQGSFSIYRKRNECSTPYYIHCTSNTTISNDVFGAYYLTRGNSYGFNLITVGRDPVLKRNNIFIAKRRIYQLIAQGTLTHPGKILKEIAQLI
jgi:hypothetical protein